MPPFWQTGLQVVALSPGVVSPTGHGVHVRSAVADPGVATMVPATQVVQASHCVAG